VGTQGWVLWLKCPLLLIKFMKPLESSTVDVIFLV
jgi:hypothetical protein